MYIYSHFTEYIICVYILLLTTSWGVIPGPGEEKWWVMPDPGEEEWGAVGSGGRGLQAIMIIMNP